jgi:hypothetical protein
MPCYSSEFTDGYRAARANGNCRPLFLRGIWRVHRQGSSLIEYTQMVRSSWR